MSKGPYVRFRDWTGDRTISTRGTKRDADVLPFQAWLISRRHSLPNSWSEHFMRRPIRFGTLPIRLVVQVRPHL